MLTEFMNEIPTHNAYVFSQDPKAIKDDVLVDIPNRIKNRITNDI